MRAHTTRLGLSLSALLAGCAASAAPAGDPAQGEVPLPAAAGWNAYLVLDAGETGVWTVGARDVFPQYATPELVALDDAGRAHVLISYSGKWTDLPRVHDGKWLGALAHGDVDPRVPGSELYVGGQAGNLYQLVPYAHGALDARLVAHLPGREIHTLVAGELDETRTGPELLVFTRPGGLFRLTPTAAAGGFELEELEALPGRVRHAALLPEGGRGSTSTSPGEARRVATVGRDGALRILGFRAGTPVWEEVHRESMGMGRVALAPGSRLGASVLYVTLDDGRVLRFAEGADGWENELVDVGPQGPRGVVAGSFDDDPATETVAVFGYSGDVRLLTRRAEGTWRAETIFRDRDRGHWLGAAELDGRNGTLEIFGSGYGGRVFLLSRPPGYGY